MLTINTVSGILNLMSNGGLGTHSGTTHGSQNQSNTLGSGGDLSATQVVSASSGALASSSLGGATTGGGMSSGSGLGAHHFDALTETAQDAPDTSSAAVETAKTAQTQTLADMNGQAAQVLKAGLASTAASAATETKNASDTAAVEITAADQSRINRITERLLTAMATRSFKETATKTSAPEEQVLDMSMPDPAQADDNSEAQSAPQIGSSSSSLAVQERLIRAELHAKLSQMAKTQDVGPADALRMMAGHNPQFPLEEATT